MFSAICGAVGKYDASVVESLVDSIRRNYDSVDFFKEKEAMIAGLHCSGKANLIQDDGKGIWVAVAGDVFARSDKKNEIKWGSSSIASIWRSSEITPSRADGAFVCVVYDREKKLCYAFNDFVGQIPLFYTEFRGATYFASQLAPFLLNESIPKFIDKRGLNLFLSFGCVPGSDTIMARVKKILPGSVALISPDSVQSRKHWRIGNIQPDYSSSIDEFTESIATLLGSSVQSKLWNAKRPIGVLLGGLDSSLIASLIRKFTSERIVAITATFEDPRFNERGTRQVSSQLDLDLKEVQVTHEEMPTVIEMMSEAFDEPVADMIACPIAFAITKKSLGLVNTYFDGTGADDLFQGIPHRGRKMDILMDILPNTVQSTLRKGLDKGLRASNLKNRMSVLVSPMLIAPMERELMAWRSMQEAQVTGLLTKAGERINKEVSTSLLKPILKDLSSDTRGMRPDRENISIKTAISLYFGPTHGFDCSRNRAISNKLGVSVTSPFYDNDLYNVGLSVPWYFKTPSKGLSKPLLRRLAIKKKLLLPNVALLKKMGLGSSRASLVDTQMKLWAENELSGWIENTIERHFDLVRHLIDKDHMMRISGKKRTSQIFQILMLVLWYKRYFGERVVSFDK